MYTLSVKMYGYLIKLIFALEIIFKAKKKTGEVSKVSLNLLGSSMRMSNKNHAKSISITYMTNSPKSTVFRRIVYPAILCFTYLGRKEKHSDLNCEHYKLHVINNSKAVYTHTRVKGAYE